jgi:putative ABC transport system permease protein
MGIILKYIIKNIAEKKLRTFLVIFSVAVSSALFFASSAITGSLVNMFSERMQQYYGSSDFRLFWNSSASSSNFSTENAKPYMDQLDYIIGGFEGSAEYKHSDDKKYSISLIGMDLEKHKIVSPVTINKESGLYPFNGKKIIINAATAERFGWKPGDSIELMLNNSRHKFTVAGIAAPTGFLFDDGESNCAIVPVETLASLYDMRGRDNVLYVKLKNPEEKRQMLDKFRNIYKGYGYGTFSMTTSIDIPLKLLTVIVCFMSVFIIYSTFKVITLEKLPVIGTFRSIGATTKMTSLLLLAESIVYGIIGGILGCALGIGVLYIMAGITRNDWTRNMKTSLIFTPIQMVTAFGIAVILCIASSVVPILKISRISIKEIIFNAIEKQYKKVWWKAVLGLSMLLASVIIPNFIPEQLALVIDMSCLIMLAVSAVLLTPYLTRFITRIMELLYTLLFGNMGILAAKNLRENKSILNSISLLIIGISTLLLVTTASDSMSREVINTFDSNYNFDIRFYHYNANKYMEQVIRTVDGVSGTYGLFTARRINVRNFNESIQQIDGIGGAKYFDFWKINVGGDPGAVVKELDSGRNIMLSNSLNYLLKLNKGDRITLEMPKGNRDYKVIGFFDSALSNGNHALASERYIKLDTGSRYYTFINIKTSKNPSVVAEDIRNEFRRMEPTVDTVNDMEKRSMEGNRQISDILTGFAALTLLIGIIGVFNNLLISFIERKHSLAVLKSVGMSRFQTVKMIFMEALTGGLIGGITGTITGSFQLLLVPGIMRATGQYFPIHYNLNFIFVFIAVGMAITLIASISPALKSSKLDIVSSLKYE